MKLSLVLLSAIKADWEQPTFAEVQASWARKSGGGWGAPVGKGNVNGLGESRHWSDCPPLDTSSIPGIHEDGPRCDGATCALRCKPGYLATGNRRTKCRWSRKLGWYWKSKLGACETCDPAEPTSNDPNMTVSCKINVNTNRKFCKFQCPPTHVFGGINNQPNMRFTKIACKCPRGPNGRKCNWFNKRNIANFQNYECIAKATPAPVSEPGVATTAAVTTAGATTAGATTAGATTAGGTTAAVTTVAATTGGSGGGSIPVCPTGNTLIMADGTVTCPDGSTPVGGTPATTQAATTAAAGTTPSGGSGNGSGAGSGSGLPVCPTGNTLILADGTVTCPDGSTPVGGTPVTTQAATTPAATTPAATSDGSTPMTSPATTPAATTHAATTPAATTPAATTPAATTPAATTPAATTPAATTPAATTPAATTPAATTAPATTANPCLDPSTKYGLKEDAAGRGGCAPKLVNYGLGMRFIRPIMVHGPMIHVNGDVSTIVPADPHALQGIHIDSNSYIVAGVGAERPGMVKLDAFVARYDLCDNLADNTNPLGTTLDTAGTDCKTNLRWAWSSGRAGRDDMFGYVAASPDKSYVIAVGLREGSDNKTFYRWMVKIDAETGQTVWEVKLPNTAQSGQHSGYESIVFTEDGGFIAAGFANYQGEGMPAYKSGGQVDGAQAYADKFSATVAAKKKAFTKTPTPTWSFVHPKSTTSFNTMRIFKENGVEKVAATMRDPDPAIVVLKTDGTEDKYGDMTNVMTNVADSFQDLEVELDASGNVIGWIVAGLTTGQDTINTANGCSVATPCEGWNGFLTKYSADFTTEVWRQQWSDFPGGVGQFSGIAEAGASLVYTECWSVTKTPTGYAVACGQGIENAAHQGDPRIAWRGVGVAVDISGKMEWYRADNWGPDGCANGIASPNCLDDQGTVPLYASSAYEWVSFDPSNPSTLMFVGDELMGFGFATYDLNQTV